MLRKMLFQGLAAAVLIAGAAGLYAAVAADNTAAPVAAPAAAANDTGYLTPERARTAERDGPRERHAERSHERRRADRDESRRGKDRRDDGDDD